MPRYAANLSMLYPERAFLDRFEAAADDGFEGVEFLTPYDHPPDEVAERLRRHGLSCVLFNAPPAGVDAAGIAAAWADARAAEQGVTVLIEPINPHDVPGYFLSTQAAAHATVQAVASATGLDTLKVQMDLYHAHRVEGACGTPATALLRQYLPSGCVGHIQIAGSPHRHEPNVGDAADGELDYAALLPLIDALGWGGWVSCEYRPRRGAEPGGTRAGLGWMRQA